MNKRLLGLIGLDISANLILVYQDEEALLICLLKSIGVYGVISCELTPIISYVFLSCIISLVRMIHFLQVFRVYLLLLNVYSTIVCFMLLNNTCHDEMVNTELGFKNNCILK